MSLGGGRYVLGTIRLIPSNLMNFSLISYLQLVSAPSLPRNIELGSRLPCSTGRI